LGQFGVHSVDELLDEYQDDYREIEIPEALSESDYEMVPDLSRSSIHPLRSILSPTPRSVTPRSSRSRVRLMDELVEIRSRSPSPVLEHVVRSLHESGRKRFLYRSNNSTAVRNITESQQKNQSSDSETTIQTLCESDTETASSARSDGASDVSQDAGDREYERNSRSSSRASSKINSAAESYYSNDFISYESDETSLGTESHTLSRMSSNSASNGNKYRIKSLRASNTEVQSKDCYVQTGLDIGDLYYYWDRETLVGRSFVDPASISATVVSADTIEALTAYTPATLALNDMLKMQLGLTCQFLATQKRLHQNLIQCLDSTQTYTTLKETKEFIRKHRKPRISMKEAIKQVRREMELK